MNKTTIPFSMLLLLCFTAVAGWGQGPAPWAVGASRAEDLVVKLVTIGPADPIYTWWGHSALIVEDGRLGVSRFYNYGLFSFEQESFVLNFAMGRLWFQVGASDSERELAFYRYLGRSIRIQTLNLPPRKRLEMAMFLENNILPQNRTYLYDHYYDNCATRVRDLIDATVDGQLARAASVAGRMSLREHTRRFTAHGYFMDWLLMFLMSEVIDHPVTRWEEMFLPSELEANVAILLYRDGPGPEKPLVSEALVFYSGSGQRTIPERATPGWPRALIPGLVLAALALLLGCLIRRGAATDLGDKVWTLFGIYSVVVGLILGLPGSALFFMSNFTDHTVTYANENLFLTNPLALVAVALGLVVAIGRNPRSRRLLQLIWLLLAALAAVYLVLKIFTFFDQRNEAALAAILPVLSGCSGAAGLSWKRI
ncbi:MAG: DUF4105 domain-containing protein [Spirochaetaceae bacterium]|nr:MAG: DUF4105 domain-containing protein [Spirochaetaceae bacterium]